MIEEEKKAKLKSTFSGIKLKKKPEPQHAQTITEPKPVEQKVVEVPRPSLSIKEKYSPVIIHLLQQNLLITIIATFEATKEGEESGGEGRRSCTRNERKILGRGGAA